MVERLKLEYGEARTELEFGNPWQLLVSVILSAQTTDVNVNSVTPILFARYPTVADLAAAEEGDVEAIIHKTGFFRSKARAIREMSQDLVLLHGGEVPSRMEELVKLRGVGRKTANVVLGVAFGEPGFAVDTHVTSAHRAAAPDVRNRSREDRGGRVQHRPAERVDGSEPEADPAWPADLHRQPATLPRVCSRRHMPVGVPWACRASQRPATSSGEGSVDSAGMLRGWIVSQSIHGGVATPPGMGTMVASQ